MMKVNSEDEGEEEDDEEEILWRQALRAWMSPFGVGRVQDRLWMALCMRLPGVGSIIFFVVGDVGGGCGVGESSSSDSHSWRGA